MLTFWKQPCDEGLIRAGAAIAPCGRAAEPWVLAATIIGSSMVFIDGTVVNLALPILQADLHATVVEVQWVFQSYALLLGALILVGGSLSDHLGHRAVFSAGVAIFAAASLTCALAPDARALIMARAFQGGAPHYSHRRASPSSVRPFPRRGAAGPSAYGPASPPSAPPWGRCWAAG